MMQNNQKPVISVVMPVYNNQKFIIPAIESVFKQTLGDFELILIDDCSTDDTYRILESYANQDERIRLIRNIEHQGIAQSRNKGNSLARGEFIVIMDHDDASLPTRFEEQVDFLRKNADVVAVGSNYCEIDELGNRRGFKSNYSTSPGFIHWRLFFGIQFLHPTIMLRRQILQNGKFQYDDRFMICPDYDLFFRISNNFKIANLPQILYEHRRHKANTASNDMSKTKGEDAQIITENLNRALNMNLEPRFGFGMMKSSNISSLGEAWKTCQVIIKLLRKAKTWQVGAEDWSLIRRGTSAKLRSIWHSQNRNIALLPYVVYSFMLYPRIINTWVGKVVAGKFR